MQEQIEPKQKHRCRYEFDEFIHGYRKLQDRFLRISGETSEYFAKYKALKLLEWFPELEKRTVKMLDYGCGDGLMTSYVARYFPNAKLVGTDPSLMSILEAQQSFSNIDFSHLQGERIPYCDNTFDMIFAAGVYHHIPLEEQRHWTREVFRVLKPKGTFVIFDINPLNPVAHYVFKTHPLDISAKMLYPWRVRRLLRSYGKVDTRFYCFFPHFAQVFRILEPYITWLPFGAHQAHIVKKK